ncbi:uncharacterized protein DEA37_0010494, partial [Paragonimus westermani]
MAYHPQGNGQVERTNRSLKSLWKAFTDSYSSREWDRAIPRCLEAYRASIHASTRHSPHYMLTGRECRLPLDLTVPHTAENSLLSTEYATQLRQDLLTTHQQARDYLSTAQKYQKYYYDRTVRGSPLQTGEQVYLKNPV